MASIEMERTLKVFKAERVKLDAAITALEGVFGNGSSSVNAKQMDDQPLVVRIAEAQERESA